jgi:hypothetical protein
MKNIYKVLISILCILSLAGCNTKNYQEMPSGTNETAAMTIAVPEQYKYGTTDTDTDDTESENIQVDDTYTKEAASARLSAFETKLQQETCYVSLKKVKTIGESVEQVDLEVSYYPEGSWYKSYNSKGELLEFVMSDSDGEYLIDDVGRTVYTAEKGTFRLSTQANFNSNYIIKDTTYKRTVNEDFEDSTLICDIYVSTDKTYKYYYDTAGNLVVLRIEDNDNVDVYTLFKQIRNLEVDTVKRPTEYVIQKYITK